MKKNEDGTDTVLESIDSFTFGEEPDEPAPTATETTNDAPQAVAKVEVPLDVTAAIEQLVKTLDLQGKSDEVRIALRDQLRDALTKTLGMSDSAPTDAPPAAAPVAAPANANPAPVAAPVEAQVVKDTKAESPPETVPPETAPPETTPPVDAPPTTESEVDKAQHMAQTAQEAAERLMSVAARAKEKGPDPRLIREVKAIAAMLGSMIEKYPSPKSMSEDDFLGLIDELERRIEGYRKAAVPAPVTKSEEPAEAVALRKTVEEQGFKLAQQDMTIADLRQQVAKLAAEPATPASRREVASPESGGEFVWPSDLADDERAQAAGLR